MNADGSGQRDLTNDPVDAPAFDITPDWSPDGTQIAFSSNRSGEDCTALYTISPNGTDNGSLFTADSEETFDPA